MPVFSSEERLRLILTQQLRLELNQIPEQPVVLDIQPLLGREDLPHVLHSEFHFRQSVRLLHFHL